jgi:hypothetical protein
MIPDWKTIFEWVDVIVFLGFGTWTTLFAYGLVSNRICGKLKWNPGFRRHAKWLGPLLVILSVLLLCM